MNLSTEVGTIAITLKVIFYLVHKKKQEPEMSESREHYLSCKEKTCTFLAFHCVQRDLHEVKGNQVVVLVTLENEREREREREREPQIKEHLQQWQIHPYTGPTLRIKA